MGVQIIKFSSEWCGPCKVMAPIFKKISKMDEFKDIEFIAYDIEEDEKGVELVEEFHIRNVPTIVIVGKNGEPIRKIIGLVQEQELINIIKDTVQYEL